MGRLLLLVLSTTFACGCTLGPRNFSGSAVAKAFGKEDRPLPVTPRVLEQLPAGRTYRVRTLDPNVTYIGKVVRTSGEELVLTDVEYERRTHSKTPILGDSPIPAIRRAFTQTGVGKDHLFGDWTFTRAQVAGVELLGSDTAEVQEIAGADEKSTAPKRLAAQPAQKSLGDG